MNPTLSSVVALSLFGAPVFAQTASTAKSSTFAHSVEAAYFSGSSRVDGFDGPSGYQLAARAYAWQNIYVTLENVDASADVGGGVGDANFKRFGYGLGASFKVGPGQMDVQATYGELKGDIEVGGVLVDADDAHQTRLTVAYSQELVKGLTGSLAATQSLNSANDLQFENTLSWSIGLDYRFGNGVSLLAGFTPDGALGEDRLSRNTWTVGAKYSF